MNNEQLTEKVCEYTRTKLAAKAQSKTVQFLLGAGTVGAGRKAWLKSSPNSRPSAQMNTAK